MFVAMFSIRTVKTASGSTAVQIVRYQNRKRVIVLHIGSARNKKELAALVQNANSWIEKTSKQKPLFPQANSSSLVALDKCQYLGFRYALVYESLLKLFTIFKFHLLHNKLLTDLVAARIIQPGSKLQSLEFLEKFMGVKHQRRNLTRQLPRFADLQNQAEAKVLAIAKKEFNFDFSLVFYDVTTLYFESFEDDELRKPGFSKDNKSQQPQIVIGLLVNNEGFPVAYQMFSGNKFEGHTLIPVILAFKRKHKVKMLTVVADAAMISFDNITALKESGLNYIVGARTGSLSPKLISEVSAALNQRDKATTRKATDYGDLICEFSQKRFAKDKREMEKQIKKAEALLKDPSGIKRTKFIKAKDNAAYELNQNLMEKTQLLLGIKGYYTNLGEEVTDSQVVQHYHNLWQVELAFRIAKSDLQMRPIYHFKEQTIKAHILICFMALAVCKYMELKTRKSTKHVVKSLKDVTDARIVNTLTGEEFTLRSPINEETRGLLAQLGLWH
jgi:transposase